MLISCENMSFGFNGGTLLDSVSFSLNETDRVGLIGANGEGKTTLIRLILGELDAEQGGIFRKNGNAQLSLSLTNHYRLYDTTAFLSSQRGLSLQKKMV